MGVMMLQHTSATRLFLKQARRNFIDTGAIAPSSRYVARAVTRSITAATGPIDVLEVGAGTGAITREIVRRLPRQSRLDVYEINPVFIKHLERRFGQRMGIKVHNARAEDVAGGPRYDTIISGLPLNNFAPSDVRRILESLFSALKPGGVLTYFEYLLIRELKSLATGKQERRRLRGVGRVTNGFLRKYEFRREAILRNIPPVLVHALRKPD